MSISASTPALPVVNFFNRVLTLAFGCAHENMLNIFMT
jgi:hypothetical protein